jgi:hypothetical protein
MLRSAQHDISALSRIATQSRGRDKSRPYVVIFALFVVQFLVLLGCGFARVDTLRAMEVKKLQ